MTDLRAMLRVDYHGTTAGDVVEVLAKDDCAWLQINNFVHPDHAPDAPQVTLYFDRGLLGHRQILALIMQLEAAAATLLDYREKADVADLVR